MICSFRYVVELVPVEKYALAPEKLTSKGFWVRYLKKAAAFSDDYFDDEVILMLTYSAVKPIGAF